MVSTEPAEGGNLTAQIVKVKFNDFLSHESVTPSSIRLLDAGDNPIAGAVEITDSAGTETRFRPNDALPLGAYRLLVTTAVQDLAGNALAQAFTVRFHQPIPTSTPTFTLRPRSRLYLRRLRLSPPRPHRPVTLAP